jgi:hypothetical protein
MTELARRFGINGGSFGPADPVAVNQFFTNGIHGGEERLMLAVLEDAIECFQQHVFAQYVWEKETVPRGGRLDSGEEQRLAFFFCEYLSSVTIESRLHTSGSAGLEGNKAQVAFC